MGFERHVNNEIPRIPFSPEGTADLSSQLQQIYGPAANSMEGLVEEALAQPHSNDFSIQREQVITPIKDFDRQFRESYTIHFGNDDLTYKKVLPLEPKSLEWVVFVGGFNSVPENYRDEVANLVESGRKVLFINPETPKTKNKPTPETKTLTSLSSLLQTEVAALAHVLEQEGIERADVVGHSRGGLLATGFAAAYPGHVNRLVLDCPAGIAGKEAPWTLMSRALSEQQSEGKDPADKERLKKGNAFLTQLTQNLKWKLLDEIPAIAGSDIRPLLTRIHSDPRRIDNVSEVILIYAHSDRIFPSGQVEEALGQDPYKYVDRWISYADKGAAHGKISHPDAGLVSEVISTNTQPDVKEEVISELLAA
ncbi:alpha/beta fold hydrolase [Patescibacteria group bacterium]|nr:alpha/beta fold hydrolase [Patescibacteria group bacterium]